MGMLELVPGSVEFGMPLDVLEAEAENLLALPLERTALEKRVLTLSSGEVIGIVAVFSVV